MKGQVWTCCINILPKTYYLNAGTLVSSSLQCPNPNSPFNIKSSPCLCWVSYSSLLFFPLPLPTPENYLCPCSAAKQILGWSGLLSNAVRRADVDVSVPSVLSFILCILPNTCNPLILPLYSIHPFLKTDILVRKGRSQFSLRKRQL